MEKLKKQKPSTARSDATAEKQTQLDNIFEQMGDFGRFQLRVFPLFCLCSTLASLQYASVPFVGYTPEHRCISPQNDMDGNQTSQIQHFFSDEHRNQSSACESVVNGSREKCHEWEFDRSVMEETYASEFNLVCDEASLVTLMAVIFLVGMAVGNVGIGLLSDRLGRRTALGCALLFLSASGLASTFSPNAVTAILFRFLIGASSSGAYITSFLFGMEVVGPKKRMFAGIIMHFFYAAGSCGASGIAYALRHWRYLQAAITAPALLLAVYTWTVPESIRWLLSRGRKEDAKLVAKGVAQQNGRHIKSYDIFDNLKVDAVPQKSKGILKELWKTPRLVFHMVLLSLIWGLVEATWFGISLNSGNIEGSIFVNYFLVGLIEFPANCVLFTINRYGRKIPFVLTMVLCGMLCLSTTFVELYTGEGNFKF
ncbi:organic cation transporter protein-like [Lingula anatina]|uniref:Organic cation transporter protein-like n=1 Tax=Lingula anatina TaxID=7574 RepID=A0A1S3H4N4_LINAN|nr:organic cation transporter protein-like [Lingula anatina]|eukprot:XP_013380094.1 organic cation transporter protein-like [Lingula anatina]